MDYSELSQRLDFLEKTKRSQSSLIKELGQKVTSLQHFNEELLDAKILTIVNKKVSDYNNLNERDLNDSIRQIHMDVKLLIEERNEQIKESILKSSRLMELIKKVNPTGKLGESDETNTDDQNKSELSNIIRGIVNADFIRNLLKDNSVKEIILDLIFENSTLSSKSGTSFKDNKSDMISPLEKPSLMKEEEMSNEPEKADLRNALLEEIQAKIQNLESSQIQHQQELAKKFADLSSEITNKLRVVLRDISSTNEKFIESILTKIYREKEKRYLFEIQNIKNTLDQLVDQKNTISGLSGNITQEEGVDKDLQEESSSSFASKEVRVSSDIPDLNFRIFAERPQNGFFFRTSNTIKPEVTLFEIVAEKSDSEEAYFSLICTLDNVLFAVKYPEALQAAAKLDGPGLPSPNHTIRLTSGKLLQDGEFWKIVEKMNISWE